MSGIRLVHLSQISRQRLLFLGITDEVFDCSSQNLRLPVKIGFIDNDGGFVFSQMSTVLYLVSTSKVWRWDNDSCPSLHCQFSHATCASPRHYNIGSPRVFVELIDESVLAVAVTIFWKPFDETTGLVKYIQIRYGSIQIFEDTINSLVQLASPLTPPP